MLARNEAEHGTVVITEEQTAGRGQRGRSWNSAPGLDLMMSVVLVPDRMRVDAQFTVAKAMALAVHEVVAGALERVGKDPERCRIKWPNDILVDDRKIAGILIENELQGTTLRSCIVGIGINVNSRAIEELRHATSLFLETGAPMDREALLETLFHNLERWWKQALVDRAEVGSAFSDRLWAKGRYADLLLDGAPCSARVLDVDAGGRLVVEDDAGAVATYGLERLRFLPLGEREQGGAHG